MAEITENGSNEILENPIVQAFSETNRNYFVEKGLSNEEAIINALKSAESFKGKDLSKMIDLPNENSKPEDVLAIFNKLGRPAKPEDYGISAPEGQDAAFAKEMPALLHAAGLTKGQATALTTEWNKYVSTKNTEANAKYQKEMGELKTEWTDKYDTNIAAAKFAAAKFGVDREVLEQLEKAGGSKGLWKFFLNLSEVTKDAMPKGGSSSNEHSNITDPKQAQEKIQALMKDADFAAKVANGDKEASELFHKLHVIAMGGK